MPSHLIRLGIAVAMVFVAPRSAGAVAITHASCAQQSGNMLRYDCTVTTDASAEVWIDLCEGSSCTFDRESESSPSGTAHAVTVWNLKPNTQYEWQAYADDGSSPDTDGTYSFTTQDLDDPDGDGRNEGDLSTMVLTQSSTGSYDVENVLFNFACKHSFRSDDFDYLVIANSNGDIVWYQDVRLATGYSPSVVTGFTVGRRGNHIHAILDNEYIVEYDLSGELIRLMCRCDVAGECSNGEVPDVCFDDFVHRDLMVKGQTTWALTAEEVSYSDVDDCDGDTGTSTIDFIMDGVNVWNSSGDLIAEWDMSEIYTPSGCGDGGYWSATGQMYGEDWTHTNSIWVDTLDDWTLSVHHLDRVLHVVGDPRDARFGTLIWELSGVHTDRSDDWALSSTSYDQDFSKQHHVWWMRDGSMMLYDNHNLGATETRALKIEFDDDPMTAEIVEEYDLSANCIGQGSAFEIPPRGHVLAFCSDDFATPGDADPFVHEFDESGDSPVWELTIACDGSATPPGYRDTPSYRGHVFEFEH